MTECFFVSDLHGSLERYDKLFAAIEKDLPPALFVGGDLLPHRMKSLPDGRDFITDYLFPELQRLQNRLEDNYPQIFLILGNDDPASEEKRFLEGAAEGLFQYINQKKVEFGPYKIFGYSFIPPSPFQLKDWEKYDVSRYVDPGCVHPTEGFRTVDPGWDVEYATIKDDLESLAENEDLEKAVFLFHSPPYKTWLDRADLDEKMIDYVPLDVHVGSIAIRRFIEERQPMLTLHGHIHESTRLTGHWKQEFNRTVAFNAAHDGPELSLVRFTLDDPAEGRRLLL